MRSITALTFVLAFFASSAGAQTLQPVAQAPVGLVAAKVSTVSRVVRSGESDFTYQWPGVYFETAFTGQDLFFKVGKGDEILHVSVDGQSLPPLVKPAPGFYHIGNLSAGAHTARIDVATESQGAQLHFGGFFLTPGETSQDLAKRTRRIEFIGDSHTVGYGNTSTSRSCTQDQIWATTDDTQAYGPVTARHYGADYQVNAISGRGIVRNYDGFPADFVPQAYPYELFDKSVTDTDTTWQPNLIVMALGTNDLSTPLKPTEQWKTRDDLHADYEKHYVAFVQSLRHRYPGTWFVLWATDLANGEIAAEEQKVVNQLKAAGDTKIIFMPVSGLAMSGCDWHPSTADDKTISDKLIGVVDALPGVWAQ